MPILPLFTLLAATGPGMALAFPIEDGWVAVPGAGAPVVESAGDPAPDLVIDGDSIGLWWFATRSTLSLRVGLAAVPDTGTGVVGVVVSTDGDDAGVELLIVRDGPADEVAVYTASGAPGAYPTWTRVDGVAGSVRVTDGFLEFEADRGQVEAAGWGPQLLARVGVMSGSAVGTWTDVLGCADLACAPVLLQNIVLDADDDGLSFAEERLAGTPWNDADADDDGLVDGAESLTADGDGDSLPDVLDCDSDADALPDGLEAGVTEPHAGTEGTACFRADADPTTTTNPAAIDSDGGGLFDATEDVNRDGAVGDWETDPNVAGDDVDTDGDGIADVLELRGPDASIDDVDSDGDGVSDAAEWLWDGDGDGIPAFLDDDADGDGFPDTEEGEVDTDEDGAVDAIDPDSDNDGRRDEDEGSGDIDCDGIENRIDSDDFDGYCDSAEVNDEFVDEEVERPAGELPRCQQGSGAAWLVLAPLLAVRRRR